LNGHGTAAAELFADDLAAGKVPGIRRIRREMQVGQPRAQEVREYLTALARTQEVAAQRLSAPPVEAGGALAFS
jgi:hypothetical protein